MSENKIGKTLILGTAALLGISLGVLWLPGMWALFAIQNEWLTNGVVNGLIGAVIFCLVALILMNRIFKIIAGIEKSLDNKSPYYLLFGSVGTIIGLVIGSLIGSMFNYIHIPGVSDTLPVMVMGMCGYLGFRMGVRRPDSWRKIFVQAKTKSVESQVMERKETDTVHLYKILDTSVVIDGRVFDIVKTGFIEGTIVVPLFVVHELQLIADSSDSLKRAKGRRGLDILNQLQKYGGITVEIYEGDFEDILDVDSKLVKLAKVLDGMVMTNDYNLNKICEFQNVPVLNINELANALKPAVLPGEVMSVLIVKAGTERQQGVAYLEDGTMIVVEDGHHYMNETLDVVITSSLQTAAGRMIFAKPVHAQYKIKEK